MPCAGGGHTYALDRMGRGVQSVGVTLCLPERGRLRAAEGPGAAMPRPGGSAHSRLVPRGGNRLTRWARPLRGPSLGGLRPHKPHLRRRPPFRRAPQPRGLLKALSRVEGRLAVGHHSCASPTPQTSPQELRAKRCWRVQRTGRVEGSGCVLAEDVARPIPPATPPDLLAPRWST